MFIPSRQQKEIKKKAGPVSVLFPAVLAAVFFMIACAGCGKKLFPVPPGKLRPEAVDDLTARVTPEGIELSWSVPVKNMDGSPMVELDSFELFKEEVPLDQYCQGCPPKFDQSIKIPFGANPAETRKMLYEDRTVRPGMHYRYAVMAVKGILSKSDLSNSVSVVWHAPPEKPLDLAAQAVRKGIRLSWAPPEKWTDGTPVDRPLSYRLLRREEKSEKWKHIADIKHTEFVDENARTDRIYSYRVAAFINFHGTVITGEYAEVSNVVPRDFIPPAPPKGLVAVQSDKGIELLWQQNSEMDVAGYKVYRREPDGLITLLTHKYVKSPRFVDRDRLAPGRYSYWVTAVDNADPPNESGMSSIVTIRIY